MKVFPLVLEFVGLTMLVICAAAFLTAFGVGVFQIADEARFRLRQRRARRAMADMLDYEPTALPIAKVRRYLPRPRERDDD